jgi:hypothetical protein
MRSVLSAIGPKRTSLAAPHTSAFGGKADMTFRFDPKADILPAASCVRFQVAKWKLKIAALRPYQNLSCYAAI